MSKTATSIALLTMTAVLGMGDTTVSGVEQKWVGKISDAICGSSHKAMAGQAGISDRECVIQCVSSGSKYVLATQDNKVLQIANQDFSGLKDNADATVTLTGELKGDVVTVVKIEPTSVGQPAGAVLQ